MGNSICKRHMVLPFPVRSNNQFLIIMGPAIEKTLALSAFWKMNHDLLRHKVKSYIQFWVLLDINS